MLASDRSREGRAVTASLCNRFTVVGQPRPGSREGALPRSVCSGAGGVPTAPQNSKTNSISPVGSRFQTILRYLPLLFSPDMWKTVLVKRWLSHVLVAPSMVKALRRAACLHVAVRWIASGQGFAGLFAESVDPYGSSHFVPRSLRSFAFAFAQ